MADRSLVSSLLRPFYAKGRAQAFQLPDALGDKPRVLCIDTGDLSDVLFHLPLLNAVRRRHPDARLEFLLPEKHASLVVASGLTKQCVVYKEKQLGAWRPSFVSLLKQLGKGGYAMSVVMSFSPQPQLELAALAAGAPLRLGPSHEDAWPAVNCELRGDPAAAGYLGDRLVRLAPFLGFDPAELDPRWPLPADKLRHIAQQVHFHKPNPDQMLIGFDPGLGKTGHAFALENLEFLVRQLTSQLVCRIVPLGEPDGDGRLAAFGAKLTQLPVGLARETLLDMILLLSQCDLFLAGNTDFFHLAAALGVPAIGLFSARDGEQWVPQGRDNVRVLRLAQGEKVDVATLMDTVALVTKGRTRTHSTIIPAADAPCPDRTNPADTPPSP